MPNKIFEYGEWFEILDRSLVESYLIDVWSTNKAIDEERLAVNKKQGFLSFDGNWAKAKNYIGFIQVDGFQLEIFPKVFSKQALTDNNLRVIAKHIFFWFDYCYRWKFPFSSVNLDTIDCSNLPELIINLMAEQILLAITENPLLLFEEVEETLTMPKGKINFSRYLSNGLSNGNHHKLECDRELLLYDNTLNRIIKYVTRQLMHRAKYSATHAKLNEILFLLDEVSDDQFTSSSLDKVRLNPFFDRYIDIIGICRLILDQQIYSNTYKQESQWSLLFPMEYIFEEFIAGFIEAKFSDKWIVDYQKSDMFLTEEPNKAFLMKHDIMLTLRSDKNVKVIIDTKYKLRCLEKDDPKQSVSQSDMYQMVSYAVRRGCNHILLIYPNSSEFIERINTFKVTTGFEYKETIEIKAVDIPFWSMTEHEKLTKNLFLSLRSLLDSYQEIIN